MGLTSYDFPSGEQVEARPFPVTLTGRTQARTSRRHEGGQYHRNVQTMTGVDAEVVFFYDVSPPLA